jgi:hypothetical protein
MLSSTSPFLLLYHITHKYHQSQASRISYQQIFLQHTLHAVDWKYWETCTELTAVDQSILSIYLREVQLVDELIVSTRIVTFVTFLATARMWAVISGSLEVLTSS